MASVLAVALATVPMLAHAQTEEAEQESESGQPRVVLVTNHADAAIIPLLNAELTRLGLDVVEVDHGENEVVPRDLGRAARDTESVAGFRVIVAEGTVEVWIADRVTGKVVLRELLLQGDDDVSGRATVVLRAVELLRVSLMELDAPHESRGEIEAPAGLENVTGFPESRGVFTLDLGVGVLWVSPDLDPMLATHLGVGYRLHPRIQVGASALLSLMSPEVSGPEGQATVSSRLFVATLSFLFAEPTSFLQPSVGLGAGLAWSTFTGDAEAPLLEFEEHAVGATIVVDARLGVRLMSQVHLFVGAAGYFLPSIPALEFVGRRVATFSPVSLAGTAGLRIALP